MDTPGHYRPIPARVLPKSASAVLPPRESHSVLPKGASSVLPPREPYSVLPKGASTVLPARESHSVALSPHSSIGGKIPSSSPGAVFREVLRSSSSAVRPPSTASLVVPVDTKAKTSYDGRSVMVRSLSPAASSRPTSPIASRKNFLAPSSGLEVLRVPEMLVPSAATRESSVQSSVDRVVATQCDGVIEQEVRIGAQSLRTSLKRAFIMDDVVSDDANNLIAEALAQISSIAEKQKAMANTFEQRFSTLETSMALLSSQLRTNECERKTLTNDVLPQLRNLEVSYAKIWQELEKDKEAQDMLEKDNVFTRELLANDFSYKMKALEAHVESFGSQMLRPHLEALADNFESEVHNRSYHAALAMARSTGEVAEMRRWVTTELAHLKNEINDKYIACKTDLTECRGEQHRFKQDCEASVGQLSDIVKAVDSKLNEPYLHGIDSMRHNPQVTVTS